MKRTTKTVAIATVLILAVPTVVWASHRFEDVGDSNVFHADIDWLAQAGVTRGCNPPENTRFCPEERVTREQMAAFLHRLADSRVVDAGSVGGFTAEELLEGVQGPPGPAGTQVVATGTTDEHENQFEVPESPIQVQEATIDAPMDGILWVTGSITMHDLDAGTLRIWAQLDDSTCSEDVETRTRVAFAAMSLFDGPQSTSGVANGMVAVGEGEHTITLCAEASHFGTQPTEALIPSIEALFIADGSLTRGLTQ